MTKTTVTDPASLLDTLKVSVIDADRKLQELREANKASREDAKLAKASVANEMARFVRAIGNGQTVLADLSRFIRENFSGAGLEDAGRKTMERRRKLVASVLGGLIGTTVKIVNTGSTKSPVYQLELDSSPDESLEDKVLKVVEKAGLDASILTIQVVLDGLMAQRAERAAADTAALTKVNAAFAGLIAD